MRRYPGKVDPKKRQPSRPFAPPEIEIRCLCAETKEKEGGGAATPARGACMPQARGTRKHRPMIRDRIGLATPAAGQTRLKGKARSPNPAKEKIRRDRAPTRA